MVLVGALMGHASTNTTMGYIVPFISEGAEVVAKLGVGVGDDELAARRRRATA